MYTIKSIRSSSQMHAPGETSLIAEATIELLDKNGRIEKEAFVTVCWALGQSICSFSFNSDFDYLTGITDEEPTEDLIEEYSSLQDAQDSEYIDIYCFLERILSQMFNGPKKYDSAKTELGNMVTHAEYNEDSDEFFFFVSQPFKYYGEDYEAKYSIETDDVISIELRKNNVIIEQYDDFEVTFESEWFGLYCKIKNELISFINSYEHENKVLGSTYAYIMSELLND